MSLARSCTAWISTRFTKRTMGAWLARSAMHRHVARRPRVDLLAQCPVRAQVLEDSETLFPRSASPVILLDRLLRSVPGRPRPVDVLLQDETQFVQPPGFSGSTRATCSVPADIRHRHALVHPRRVRRNRAAAVPASNPARGSHHLRAQMSAIDLQDRVQVQNPEILQDLAERICRVRLNSAATSSYCRSSIRPCS